MPCEVDERRNIVWVETDPLVAHDVASFHARCGEKAFLNTELKGPVLARHGITSALHFEDSEKQDEKRT